MDPRERKRSLIKVIVIGNARVGKTALIHQFTTNRFNPNYKVTIGADFSTKEVIVDQKIVSLQIWDTAGQEKYHSLGSAFYNGAECCVIVFDITDQKSFERIEFWRNEFLDKANPEDSEYFPFILIGNKVDLNSERSISTSKAQKWCRENGGIQYFETSAKSNENVVEAFTHISRDALKFVNKEFDKPGTSKKLQLESMSMSEINKTKEKKCCKV